MSADVKTETPFEDDEAMPARMRLYPAIEAAPWVSAAVSEIRSEAAGQRRRRKAAEAEGLREALRDAERRAHGLPAEALPRITGDDPLSNRADAEFWATALGGTWR